MMERGACHNELEKKKEKSNKGHNQYIQTIDHEFRVIDSVCNASFKSMICTMCLHYLYHIEFYTDS